jgi:hypothetical protein
MKQYDRYRTDIENNLKIELENVGITVIESIRKRSEQYEQYEQYDSIPGSEKYTPSRQLTDTEFVCSIDENMAIHITTLDERLRNAMSENRDLYASQRVLTAQVKKIDELKDVLKNNPAINDQWDEMMIMLKIAGFDKII